MAINESLKISLKTPETDLTWVDIAISSSIAGSISSIITNPLDVIKTKLQTQHDGLYKNIGDTATTIWKRNGVSGFFSGVIPRIMYYAPSTTISWCCYEGIKKYLEKRSFSNSFSKKE